MSRIKTSLDAQELARKAFTHGAQLAGVDLPKSKRKFRDLSKNIGTEGLPRGRGGPKRLPDKDQYLARRERFYDNVMMGDPEAQMIRRFSQGALVLGSGALGAGIGSTIGAVSRPVSSRFPLLTGAAGLSIGTLAGGLLSPRIRNRLDEFQKQRFMDAGEEKWRDKQTKHDRWQIKQTLLDR